MVNGINGINLQVPQSVNNFSTRAGSFLTGLDGKADAFLKASKTTAADGALMSAKAPWYIKYANQGPLKYFGKFANKLDAFTIKGANKVGEKLVTAASKGGFLSKVFSKVPFLGKVANGLKGLNKVPGLGTIITAGTAVFGIGKAAMCALKGDFAGAGHQLLKTGGTTLGLIAGTALMATGIGFLPGLALAVGAGFLGDKVGQKAADTFFPSVAARQQAEAEMAQGGGSYAPSFSGNSNSKAGYPEDAVINSILHNPKFY